MFLNSLILFDSFVIVACSWFMGAICSQFPLRILTFYFSVLILFYCLCLSFFSGHWVFSNVTLSDNSTNFWNRWCGSTWYSWCGLPPHSTERGVSVAVSTGKYGYPLLLQNKFFVCLFVLMFFTVGNPDIMLWEVIFFPGYGRIVKSFLVCSSVYTF